MAGTRTKRKDHRNKTVDLVFTGQYLHRAEVRKLRDEYLRGNVSDKDLVQHYEELTRKSN